MKLLKKNSNVDKITFSINKKNATNIEQPAISLKSLGAKKNKISHKKTN